MSDIRPVLEETRIAQQAWEGLAFCRAANHKLTIATLKKMLENISLATLVDLELSISSLMLRRQEWMTGGASTSRFLHLVPVMSWILRCPPSLISVYRLTEQKQRWHWIQNQAKAQHVELRQFFLCTIRPWNLPLPSPPSFFFLILKRKN